MSRYKSVEKREAEGTENEQIKIVAQGFTQTVSHAYVLEDVEHKWMERLLFVQSDYYKIQQQERLFKAFDGISIGLVFEKKQLKFALLTKLEPVQRKIIRLLALDENLYEHLRAKIQIFFTNSISIES